MVQPTAVHTCRIVVRRNFDIFRPGTLPQTSIDMYVLVLAPHRYQTLPTEASTTPNSRYAVQTSTVVLVAVEGLGSIGCLERAQFRSVVLSTAVSCVEVGGCRFVFLNRERRSTITFKSI